MVLKLWRSELTLAELFENDVKMYGTQTECLVFSA